MGYPYEVLYYPHRNSSRTEQFLEGLHGKCAVKAYRLIEKLAEYGPNLPRPRTVAPLKGAQKGIWELRDHCPGRAIRFYFWESGTDQYTIAWGELKVGDSPNPSVIRYVTRAYQDWEARSKAN